MDTTLFRNRITGYDNVAPQTLTANSANFRRHPQAQADALAGALTELGWLQDVVINRTTGLILDGHLRVELALKHNEPSVPVKYVELSEAEERLALATLDAITGQATIDPAALMALLGRIEMQNVEDDGLLALLGQMGAEAQKQLPREAVDAEPQIDRASELQQLWGTSTGQLWALGEHHRLICGDCTDAGVVARVMGGDCFDLVITSPPYNSGDGGYKTDYYGKTKRFYQEDTDDRTEAEWVTFCECVLSNCGQHARDDKSVIAWNVMYTARCRSGYGQVLFGGRQPFTVKETICWDKARGFPTASKGILSRNWELIFILSKGEKYNTTQGDNESRWAKWQIARPEEQEENHKATFPIELAAKAMADFSFDGDIVLDPFSGSGTTGIACENLGRRARMVEISPAYVAVALQRFADATATTPQLLEGP